MEGTPHEKILIVIASYVIGFITAFILLGLDYRGDSTNVVYSQELNHVTHPNDFIGGKYSYENGYLEVVGKKGVRILSYNPKIVNDTEKRNIPSEIHYTKPKVLLSADNDYLYFCLQAEEEVSSCKSYIYSYADDLVHPVLIDGKPFSMSVEILDVVLWNNKGLKIDILHSVSKTEPWILTE